MFALTAIDKSVKLTRFHQMPFAEQGFLINRKEAEGHGTEDFFLHRS